MSPVGDFPGSYLHKASRPAASPALAVVAAWRALLARVEAGERVAFVTDAGMPSVSDPGTALVRAAAARELAVTVVPGPSAVSTAVALSGLVEAAYLFAGFLPRAGQKRRAALEAAARSAEPVVLFEAADEREIQGEVVLVLGPGEAVEVLPDAAELDRRIREALAAGSTARDVPDELAVWSGRPRREVYARVLELRRG